MLSIKELRPLIEKYLDSLIGTYTYPNGTEIKAISVGNPSTELEVDGLEVILPMFPKTEKACWLSNEIYFLEYWEIYLIKRKNCTNETFFEACQKLKRSFPYSNSNYMAAESDLAFPQFVISFRWEDLEATFTA